MRGTIADGRAILDAAMSEAELQREVIECAQYLGYRVAHFRPARTKDGWRTPVAADGRGFPDLVMVREHPAGHERVVYAELKSQTGEVEPDQQAWIDALRAAGEEVYVWYPRHWSSGLVEAVLRGEDAHAD